MAAQAVLGVFRMLVHIGAAFFPVASQAGGPHRFSPEHPGRACAVGLVAVGAEHLGLRHRMAAGKRELGPYILVALVAHLGGLLGVHDEVRAGMNPVAVRAGHLGHGMGAGAPVVEVEGGIGSVALKAYQGEGPGGQGLQVYEGLVLAGKLLALGLGLLNLLCRYALNGQASRAVAAFAVHQGQPRLGRKLRPHGAGLKVPSYLVVAVAGTEAAVGAHIVGIEAAHHEALVLLYGHYGLGSLQGLAAPQGQHQQPYQRWQGVSHLLAPSEIYRLYKSRQSLVNKNT